MLNFSLSLPLPVDPVVFVLGDLLAELAGGVCFLGVGGWSGLGLLLAQVLLDLIVGVGGLASA